MKQLATVSDFLTHSHTSIERTASCQPLFDVSKTFDVHRTENKGKISKEIDLYGTEAIVRSRALIRNPERRGQFRGIQRNSDQ